MKLLRVLECLLWVWACHGLPLQEPGLKIPAEECVMYRTKSPASPVIQFQQRVSLAVLPQESRPTARLMLHSVTTGKSCQFFFMPGSITPICGKDTTTIKNLEESDITELWMEVVGRTDDPASAVWDLKVVVRQGKNRIHQLFPDTGLQPPVNMWLISDHMIHYYFNCVTGCLFDKSVTMAPGDHTFFLRYDASFVQMTLDAGSHQYPLIELPGNKTVQDLPPPGEGPDTGFMLRPASDPNESGLPPLHVLENVKQGTKKLSINVTAAELGPAVGLKEVTVVWNEQLGDIGILVEGSPLDGRPDYKPLGKERQVKVEVAEEGGGYVAPCNPHFQMVACGDDEEVTKARSDLSTSTTTTTIATTSSETTPGPTTGDAIQQSLTSQQESNEWLPALFTIEVLNFIVTVAAVSFAALLYYRSSSNNCQLTKEHSTAPAIFSRRFSTRSSTRSTQRGSQRRKTQNDGDRTAEENVNSETVTTPLTTPDSLANPRKQRNLSTDEFIDLSLT